jgi:hypothetical protein
MNLGIELKNDMKGNLLVDGSWNWMRLKLESQDSGTEVAWNRMILKRKDPGIPGFRNRSSLE